MRARLFACLLCLIVAVATGGDAIAQSTAKEKSGQAKFDACTLIRKNEIEAVQGSPVRETKSSERSDGDFRLSQCFYTAAEFSRSVTLVVFQKHADRQRARSPIDFWKHTFDRYAKKEDGDSKEKEPTGREEREEGAPPRKIDRLGDDAYWVSNRFGGTLYILKGDTIISISLGGTDSEQIKIDKSKKLASKALRRF
jgi:hypothetical protein